MCFGQRKPLHPTHNISWRPAHKFAHLSATNRNFSHHRGAEWIVRRCWVYLRGAELRNQSRQRHSLVVGGCASWACAVLEVWWRPTRNRRERNTPLGGVSRESNVMTLCLIFYVKVWILCQLPTFVNYPSTTHNPPTLTSNMMQLFCSSVTVFIRFAQFNTCPCYFLTIFTNVRWGFCPTKKIQNK